MLPGGHQGSLGLDAAGSNQSAEHEKSLLTESKERNNNTPERCGNNTVSIEKDLFDDVVVVRSWGGTDTRRGGMEREVVASQEDGARLLEAISRRRAMRGYRRVN